MLLQMQGRALVLILKTFHAKVQAEMVTEDLDLYLKMTSQESLCQSE